MNNVNDLSVLLICDLSASFVYLCTVCSFHSINTGVTPENTTDQSSLFDEGRFAGAQGWAPSKSPGPHKEIPVEILSKGKARITPKWLNLFSQQGHGDEVKQACESRAYSTYHTAGYELPWSEEVSSLCTGDWTLITAGLGLKLKCVTCIHWSGGQVDRGCALMIWWLL